jgi:CheY-like chemotaxis protein
MMNPERPADFPSRRVLLVIEDETLAEVLGELLAAAGHEAAHARQGSDLEVALGQHPFDAILVDLDTRARDGGVLVERLRRWSPTSTIVALLPCGGLPPGTLSVPYHLALEKPARVGAVLAALHVTRKMQ